MSSSGSNLPVTSTPRTENKYFNFGAEVKSSDSGFCQARDKSEFHNTVLTHMIGWGAPGSDNKNAHEILNSYRDHSDYINLTDLCPQSGCGNSALMLAVMRGQKSVALRLIELGANVNIKNNDGDTPLHYACLLRDNDLVTLLLKNGAKFDEENNSHLTPQDFYFYDFQAIHVENNHHWLRELELIAEHQPSWVIERRDPATLAKPDASRDNPIAEKFNRSLSSLVKNSLPFICIIDNQANFDKYPLIKSVYSSYEEFQESCNRIRAEGSISSNVDLQNALREKFITHLQKQYVLPYQKSGLPSASSSSASGRWFAVGGISLMLGMLSIGLGIFFGMALIGLALISCGSALVLAGLVTIGIAIFSNKGQVQQEAQRNRSKEANTNTNLSSSSSSPGPSYFPSRTGQLKLNQQAMFSNHNTLNRFTNIQDRDQNYDMALQEMKAGKKKGHWIWYILPQLRGLGASDLSKRYAIQSIDEACAYLDNPVLFKRYSEIVAVIRNKLINEAVSPALLMGGGDVYKLNSSLKLFREASRLLLNKGRLQFKELYQDCDLILKRLNLSCDITDAYLKSLEIVDNEDFLNPSPRPGSQN